VIVYRRYLRDGRRWLVWWSAGMVVLNLLTAAFFPTVEGDQSFDNVVAGLPAPMKSLIGLKTGMSISTAPGYLNARLFSLLLPVLLVIFAIGSGARAIAGAEDDGTLELLLANPVTRTRVVVERFAATCTLLAALVLVSAVSLLAIAPPFGLFNGVALSNLLQAYVAAFCLSLLFGAVAFGLGAALGLRSTSLGISAAVAVGGYLLQALLANSPSLDWLRSLSPWQWYGAEPIIVAGGTAVAYVPALVATVVVTAAGWWRFRQRDLR
jgi:ABC-2 type transport system permease protein